MTTTVPDKDRLQAIRQRLDVYLEAVEDRRIDLKNRHRFEASWDDVKFLLHWLHNTGEASALKEIDVAAMRVNLHATFNGGHEGTTDREAFHHGMDTVCNVLAAYQKGERTNGILPPPDAETLEK